jgi:hypothetical protein
MKKMYLVLAIPVLFLACNKSVTPGNDLSSYLVKGPTDSLDIVGNWILIASRHYNVNNFSDTAWTTADTVHDKVVIEFAVNDVFSYNDKYSHKDEQLDLYRYLDSGVYKNDPAFYIYALAPSTGFIFSPPTFGRLQNQQALIITYMGIDAGDEELYIKSSDPEH